MSPHTKRLKCYKRKSKEIIERTEGNETSKEERKREMRTRENWSKDSVLDTSQKVRRVNRKFLFPDRVRDGKSVKI